MRLWKLILLLVALVSIAFPLQHDQAHASTPQSFTFGAAGDHGDITVPGSSLTTLTSLGASGASFYLALGDLRNGTTDEQTWCNSFKSKFTNVELIAGEEESGEVSGAGDISKFITYCPFTLSVPVSPGEEAGYGYGYEYYFDYPGASPIARIIMISPGISFTVGGLNETWAYSKGDNHYSWLSDTIDNARTLGIQWIIVGMNNLCITSGQATCQIGEDVNNLLVGKGVDLVLQAHDRTFQRSKQLLCVKDQTYRSYCVATDGSPGSYTKGRGTIFQVVGTFGQGHSAIKTTRDTDYFAATNNDTFGYMSFSVGTGSITARFINTVGSFADNYGITIVPTPSPYPVLVGWGGMWTGETDLSKSDPNNPSSVVFFGEKASDAEIEMRYLVAHGYNTERAIFRSPFTSDGENYPDERGYYDPWLNRTITIAKTLGIYIIVNMHSFCDWVNSTYTCSDPETHFVGSNVESQWLSFWNTSIVQRYKNYYDNIIWEPLNEPIVSATTKNGTALGFPGNPLPLQGPYQDFITTVRSKQGDKHWVIMSNAQWGGDFPVVSDPLNRILLNRHWYHFYNDGGGIYDQTAYQYPNYDASDKYQITRVNCSWSVNCAKAKGDDVNIYVRTAMARFGRPFVSTEVGAQWHDGTVQQPPDSLWNSGACTYAASTLAFVQKIASNFDGSPGRVGYTLWMNGHRESGVNGCINVWGYQISSIPAVPPPDFGLSTRASIIAMSPSSSVAATITVTSLDGFSGTVSLSETVSPTAGLATALNPTNVTVPGSSTLKLSSSTPRNYTIVVTGISGTSIHRVNLTIVVSTNNPPLFTTTFFLLLGGGTLGALSSLTLYMRRRRRLKPARKVILSRRQAGFSVQL